MKTLHELLRYFGAPLSFSDAPLVGLFRDSRQVIENSVFVAVQGEFEHGLTYLEQALSQGAKAVLTDRKLPETLDVPVLVCANLSDDLPTLASWFYDDPSQKLKIIGITGTNGKTSTAHFLAQLLSNHSTHKVGVLGTLGNGLFGDLRPSPNTTLETLALHHQLNAFVKNGVTHVVMEVSSHAVALNRIDRIHFEGLVLTQVTRDHLDFHVTEEAYRATKKRLFTDFASKFWVVNHDDALGLELISRPSTAVKFSYAKTKREVTSFWRTLAFDQAGFSGKLILDGVEVQAKIPLFGGFNAENVLAALTAYTALTGWDFDAVQLSAKLASLIPVPGRMQKVVSRPAVIVDYAHTPDALEAVLTAVREHLPSHSKPKLWVLFGCGGDRDRGKRPLMGAVAERMADRVMITDDNPRFENPEKIVQDILKGMKTSPEVIHSRPLAIEQLLLEAAEDDVVILAGKGHENYQEIKGRRWTMDDVSLVQSAIRKLKRTQEKDK